MKSNPVDAVDMAAKSAAMADAFRRLVDVVAAERDDPQAPEALVDACRDALRTLSARVREYDLDAEEWADVAKAEQAGAIR
jgi:hypothetical protein